MISYPETPTLLTYGKIVVGSQQVFQVVSSMPPSFISAQNKDTNTFGKGSVVARDPSGSGLLLASCVQPIRAAIGMATEICPPTFAVVVQLAGEFCMNDWTPIIGAANLAPMSYYWLDATAGRLIPHAPGGGISQLVGYAVSPVTLCLDVQLPILMSQS